MNNINELINKTAAAIEANNMQAFIADTKEEAAKIALSLIPDGGTVTMGGSKSVNECGIPDMLREGNYKFLDRTAPGVTNERKEEIYRLAFSCDAYLTSSNAITKGGALYNVDGNANRVAAMLFGPKSVIVVAGYNKICDDLDAAIERVKRIAAPLNCERLGIDNYCREAGECVSLKKDKPSMCDGCASDKRICCSYTVIGRQRIKDRIKVILVKEELGM